MRDLISSIIFGEPCLCDVGHIMQTMHRFVLVNCEIYS